jgi:hypothetical protein
MTVHEAIKRLCRAIETRTRIDEAVYDLEHAAREYGARVERMECVALCVRLGATEAAAQTAGRSPADVGRAIDETQVHP